MTYRTIQPPFEALMGMASDQWATQPSAFMTMTKDELRRYGHWFEEQIPARVRELARAVAETPGYENWSADETPVSLDPLDRWFTANVKTRPRTAQEIASLKAQDPYPIEHSPYELTPHTLSVAIDVGMYFAQVLRRNGQGLRWEQPLRSKSYVDYGQPVLRGGGRVPLNPVRIAVTHAWTVARKKAPTPLRELYTRWSRLLAAGE